MSPSPSKPLVLITGAGRKRSIAASIATGLAQDGWDLVLNHWQPYDERLDLDRGADDPGSIADECRAVGADVTVAPGDLSDPAVPGQLLATAAGRRVEGLVLSHCESVDSSILTTDVASWDRHFAVNARASWLLIKAFAEQLPESAPTGTVNGRIVALTSDHTAENLPYGASKGALDRLVIAAAIELAGRGVRSNLINPGPIDTGWMDAGLREEMSRATPAGRLGQPQDTADLVRFLFSDAGSWINGQLLHSNGGLQTS
ncbi:SDR family oxidoreductase [Arthrobacter rhombi]|uniref:SDR family oxidoreductase n=1 Tax=Arthrobacter rhombi TaxID=71253 RepID=UPI0031D9E4D2